MRNNTNKRLLAFVLSSVLLLTVLIGGLSLMLFSSNSGNASDPMTDLFLNAPTSMTIGDQEKLSAEAKSLSGITKAIDGVAWKSLDNKTYIDKDGNLSAGLTGIAKIEASYNGFTSVREVNIRPTENNVIGTIETQDGYSTTMVVGETQHLSATFKDHDLSVTGLDWSSNNAGSVSVDQNGNITAKKYYDENNVATITARVSGTNDVAVINITVVEKDTPSSQITLSTDKTTIGVGLTTTIKVSPENAQVTWGVLGYDNVVSVSNGVVTGLKEGTATVAAIRAGSGDNFDTIKITVVNDPVTDVTISGKADNVSMGQLIELSSIVSPTGTTDQRVKWSTPDYNYVNLYQDEKGTELIVDSESYDKVWLYAGAVTSEDKKVSVKAERDGMSDEFTFSIAERLAAESVKIDRGSFTMADGQNGVQLTATVLPESASQEVIWNVENEDTDVLTIDENTGYVTSHNQGTARVWARAKYRPAEVSNMIIITVEGKAADLDHIEISHETLRVAVGQTLQMTAKVFNTSGNVVNALLAWESNQIDVATIDRSTGLLTAKKEGPTTIKVFVEGNDDIKDYVDVIVIPTPDATSLEIQGQSGIGVFGTEIENGAPIPFGTVAQFKAVASPIGAVENVKWTFNTFEALGKGVRPIDKGTVDGVKKIEFQKISQDTSNDVTLTIYATHTNGDNSTVQQSLLLKFAPEPVANAIEIKDKDGNKDKTTINDGNETTLTARAFVTATYGTKPGLDGENVTVERPDLSAGVKQEFVWRSSEHNVAVLVGKDDSGNDVILDDDIGETIVQKGGDILVRPVGSGTTTIRAYVAETQQLYAEIEVTVSEAINNQKVHYTTIVEESMVDPNPENNWSNGTSGSATLYADQRLQLVAFGFEFIAPNIISYVDNTTFEWYSNHENIVSVDANGVVTQLPTAKQGDTVSIWAQAIGSSAKNFAFTITIDTANYVLNNYVENGKYDFDGGSLKYKDIKDGVPDSSWNSDFNAGNWSAALMSAYIDAAIIKRDYPNATSSEYTDLQKELAGFSFKIDENIGTIYQLSYVRAFSDSGVYDEVLNAILNPTEDNIDVAYSALDSLSLVTSLPNIKPSYQLLLERVDALVAID